MTESTSKELQSDLEEMIFRDIMLYDAQGNPLKEYAEVRLDGSCYKNSEGKWRGKRPEDWTHYLIGLGKVLPPLPVYYAIFERMITDSVSDEVSLAHRICLGEELLNFWFCTGTKVYFKEGIISHEGVGTFSHAIPDDEGDMLIETAIKRKKWRSIIQALLMPKEINRVPEILESLCNAGDLTSGTYIRPTLIIPTKKMRESVSYLVPAIDKLGGISINLVGHPESSRFVCRGSILTEKKTKATEALL